MTVVGHGGVRRRWRAAVRERSGGSDSSRRSSSARPYLATGATTQRTLAHERGDHSLQPAGVNKRLDVPRRLRDGEREGAQRAVARKARLVHDAQQQLEALRGAEAVLVLGQELRKTGRIVGADVESDARCTRFPFANVGPATFRVIFCFVLSSVTNPVLSHRRSEPLARGLTRGSRASASAHPNTTRYRTAYAPGRSTARQTRSRRTPPRPCCRAAASSTRSESRAASRRRPQNARPMRSRAGKRTRLCVSDKVSGWVGEGEGLCVRAGGGLTVCRRTAIV